MSKFHVGDKVTIHDRDELFHQFALDDVYFDQTKVYEITDADTEVGGGYDYWGVTYLMQANDGTSWDAPEEVLRPAKIVALPLEGNDLFAKINKHAVVDAVDSVNHPAHYTRFPVEVIQITEQLDFNKGNAVKYLTRAGYKDGVDELEDLSKAAWYVNRAIEKLKRERNVV